MDIKTISSFARERALVLGGGGSSGNAWLIGVIAGLFDAGLDVTKANMIIGTSAGSTTAAQITGASPAKLFADILSVMPRQRAQPTRESSGPVSNKPAVNPMEVTSEIIAAAKDADDMRRKIGAAMLEMDATSDSSAQTRWRATVAARLLNQNWPKQEMLITAVDAHTGGPVVFDHNSGVDLADAIAASCAGGFAYTIRDKQYIDGGYRSDVNADLAADYGRVLIIAPFGDKTRKQLTWGLHLAAEVNELRASGGRVETIFPDSDSRDAIGVGMNVMDFSRRLPSAEAGYNQGKALAVQLIEFWR